jgi:PAS domain S-box-containing protein
MNSIPSSAAIQSLVTIGVVVLLWSLHVRLVDRAVFRWWAWAWTCYGLYLGLATLSLPLAETWTAGKVATVILAAICGFLPPVFLYFGGRSVQDNRLPTRREQTAGLIFALVAALLVVAVSIGWSEPHESYYVRLAPRTTALAAALLFCAWVFLSQWRRNTSRASLITGIVCLLYGATQALYAAALVARVAGEPGVGSVVDPIIAWRARLFWVDQAYVYGTSIGLVLLFVEDYEQSLQALQESTHRRLEVTDQNLALQAEIEVRKRAELALQRSEEKFATAFRANPCAMAITLLDGGTILDVNDVLVRQSGYERGELVGRNADDLGFWIEPSERIAVKSELEASGRVATREVQWRSKDGRSVTVLYSADTLEVNGQRAVLSVAEDITARKRTENTHQAILKALPDWIFVLSTDGVFVDFHA